jgi:hypothetical protein
MGILNSNWLPSPEIINKAINNIILAFDDLVQVELVKVRWEEIEKLKSQLVSFK